jgi:hypothetical protein
MNGAHAQHAHMQVKVRVRDQMSQTIFFIYPIEHKCNQAKFGFDWVRVIA